MHQINQSQTIKYNPFDKAMLEEMLRTLTGEETPVIEKISRRKAPWDCNKK